MPSADSSPRRCSVVIPAAGSGTRFGSDTPKQFLLLGGRAVIAYTIRRFVDSPRVERVIISASPDRHETLRTIIASEGWKNVSVVAGGDTRQESVLRGLEALSPEIELVAVHDAVRPFFSASLFDSLIDAAAEHGASLPVLELTDTLHRLEDGFVIDSPDRSQFGLAQTPQCFRVALLREVLMRATSEGFTATDEAGAARRYGHKVRAIRGEAENFKITHQDDFRRAEGIVARGTS
jgi:2-C-methyl-D-erythritol 4-phosphate cytidylyltransferase